MVSKIIDFWSSNFMTAVFFDPFQESFSSSVTFEINWGVFLAIFVEFNCGETFNI